MAKDKEAWLAFNWQGPRRLKEGVAERDPLLYNQKIFAHENMKNGPKKMPRIHNQFSFQ